MSWLASIFAKPIIDKLWSVVATAVSKWILQISMEIEHKKNKREAQKAADKLKEAKSVEDKRRAFNQLP